MLKSNVRKNKKTSVDCIRLNGKHKAPARRGGQWVSDPPGPARHQGFDLVWWYCCFYDCFIKIMIILIKQKNVEMEKNIMKSQRLFGFHKCLLALSDVAGKTNTRSYNQTEKPAERRQSGAPAEQEHPQNGSTQQIWNFGVVNRHIMASLYFQTLRAQCWACSQC